MEWQTVTCNSKLKEIKTKVNRYVLDFGNIVRKCIYVDWKSFIYVSPNSIQKDA